MKRFTRLDAAIVAIAVSTVALALLAWEPAVLAQEGRASHPAAIHSGSCAVLGDVVADLDEVTTDFLVDGTASASTLPVGSSTSYPIQASITTVALSLADIVSADHSVVISDQDGSVVACGEIGGRTLGSTVLPVALSQPGGSGYAALAFLSDMGDGSTEFALYLIGAVPAGEMAASTAGTLVLGTELSYAGWDITIEEVTLDTNPEAREPLVVTAVFTNRSTQPRDLSEVVRGTNAYIEADLKIYPIYLDDIVRVPEGASVRVRLNTRELPEGFSLDRAVLTFGPPIQHQARLRLAEDAEGEAFFPLDLESSGNAKLKKIGRVQVRSAALVAVTCRGSADALFLDPASKDELSIILQADIIGRSPAGRWVATSIVDPDGITALGTPGKIIMRKGIVDRGIQLCYTVGAPAVGKYVIVFDGGDRSAKYKITIPELEPEPEFDASTPSEFELAE